MGRSEAQLIDDILTDIDLLAESCGLPPVRKVYRQKVISGLLYSDRTIPMPFMRKMGLRRTDLILIHSDIELTVIEVKSKSDPPELVAGMSQLMHYETLIHAIFPHHTCHKVLITPKINDLSRRVVDRYNLDIKLVDWSDRAINSSWLKKGEPFGKTLEHQP